MAVDPSKRLSQLLEMLRSDFEGERANAAGMIAKMAATEGKSVTDFIASRIGSNGQPKTAHVDRIVERVVYRDRIVYKEPFSKPRPDATGHEHTRQHQRRPRNARKPADGLYAGLRWCLNYEEHLSSWEMEFIWSVLGQCNDDADLSYSQQIAADKIVKKVQRKEQDAVI